MRRATEPPAPAPERGPAGRRAGVAGEEGRAGDGEDADRGDGHPRAPIRPIGPVRERGPSGRPSPRSGSSHRRQVCPASPGMAIPKGYERPVARWHERSIIVEHAWHHGFGRGRHGALPGRATEGHPAGSRYATTAAPVDRHPAGAGFAGSTVPRGSRGAGRRRPGDRLGDVPRRATGSSWPGTATSGGRGVASSRSRTSGSAGCGSSADGRIGPDRGVVRRRVEVASMFSRPGPAIERTSSWPWRARRSPRRVEQLAVGGRGRPGVTGDARQGRRTGAPRVAGLTRLSADPSSRPATSSCRGSRADDQVWPRRSFRESAVVASLGLPPD